MASITASFHLDSADAPFIAELEGTGRLALWVEGKHRGPTLIGSAETMAKLRDAIDAALSQSVQNEAA